MIGSRRRLGVFLIVMVLLLIAPTTLHADDKNPLVIDPEVLGSASFPTLAPGYNLMVQATSWVGLKYRYVLTLGNFSPWPMSSVRVLDRYFPQDPNGAEIDHEWFPQRIEPGQVASFVIEFPDGALLDACHQLEITLADGLGTILMDCSAPGSTTVWNVPLSDAMQSYLAETPLALAEPVGRSKLSLHVTNYNSTKIMDFIQATQPAVLVALGDLGWLAEVKKVSPKTVLIGRLPEASQVLEGDPVAQARAFVQAHLGYYRANPSVDYWLGWNEPVIDGPEQMQWYAAFEAERTKAMAELGLKVAIGNFSAGTPEADEFKAFLPAIAEAKKHGGLLALHEYSAPTLRDGTGAGIPGMDSQGNAKGSLTLRYRYWYEYYLRINDLIVPLVITEAGIDGGVLAAQGNHLLGWQDFARATLGEQASLTEAGKDYVAQLSWYDDELRRDPYVLGFAIFNVGDATGRWKSFDVTELLPQLGELAASKR